MFSRFRDHFGTAGLLVASIALVFAMLGGAYAASNPGDGGKATASAKKGPRGPRGPKGPAGPPGPQGPAGAQGAAGAKGDTGAQGEKGDTGDAGVAGTSVTNTSLPLGNEKCGFGGAQFKVGAGTPTFACNGEPGEQGPEGPEGDPWTELGTLPPGATETGTWAFNATTADTTVVAPISFPIPLGEKLPEAQTHYQTQAGFSTFCTGNSEEPTAKPGHLCVYAFPAPTNASFEFIAYSNNQEFGASLSGALLNFTMSGSGGGFGGWAVTGCSTSLPAGDPNKCP